MFIILCNDFHINPIYDLHVVSIHHLRLVIHGISDHQRNEFFGKLDATAVVSTTCNIYRHLVDIAEAST